MTKLEQLLEWMDDAEYTPSYGELREKVKELINEEQQVKSVDLADVVGSLPSTETCKVIPDNDEMFPCDVTDCCGIGPIVREKYCPECGKKIERQ
jgi:hypothetical protein